MHFTLNCLLKGTVFIYFHVNHPNWQNGSSAKRLFSNNYPKQMFQTLFLALCVLSQVQTGDVWACRCHILGAFLFSFFKRSSFTILTLKGFPPKSKFFKTPPGQRSGPDHKSILYQLGLSFLWCRYPSHTISLSDDPAAPCCSDSRPLLCFPVDTSI